MERVFELKMVVQFGHHKDIEQ